MTERALTRGDEEAVARFALMAAFPSGSDPPRDALQSPRVRRWLEGWGDELGVGWEQHGTLRGAAWARTLEPVLIYDARTGEPLPEVIIAVDERCEEPAPAPYSCAA